jgi:type II secretory pathway pseudopilin PulG
MKKNGGFTIFEIMVVLGITALLLSVTLTGLSGSRDRFTLLAERAKLADAFSRAKNFALEQLFPDVVTPVSTCGYGVHFDYGSDEYFIYQDVFDSGSETSCECNDDAAAGSNHLCAFGGTDVKLVNQSFKLPDRLNFNTTTNTAGPTGQDERIDFAHFSSPFGRAKIWSVGGNFIANMQNEGFVILETKEVPPEQVWICIGEEGGVSDGDCPPEDAP